jgi:hypothetical protein
MFNSLHAQTNYFVAPNGNDKEKGTESCNLDACYLHNQAGQYRTNPGAYQKWDVLKKTIKLEAGEQLMKLVIDTEGLNLDKMVFEEAK